MLLWSLDGGGTDAIAVIGDSVTGHSAAIIVEERRTKNLFFRHDVVHIGLLLGSKLCKSDAECLFAASMIFRQASVCLCPSRGVIRGKKVQ